MFWKKKKTDPEMFTLKAENKRKVFRVCPAEDEPIMITFAIHSAEADPIVLQLRERQILVKDISAGGLSFKNRGFREKKSYPITFDLPNQNTTISTVLEILCISEDGFCHCRFDGLEEEASDKIHEYVLKRQKKIIGKKKE